MKKSTKSESGRNLSVLLFAFLFLPGVFGYFPAAYATTVESSSQDGDISWAISSADGLSSVTEYLTCTTPGTPVATPATVTICSGSSTSILANSTSATHIYWYTGSCGGTFITSSVNNTSKTIAPTTTTTYYLRGYNASGGCFSTTCATVTVTVAPKPLTPFISLGSATVCSGNSVSLSASSTNATYIYWYTGSCGGSFVGSSNNNVAQTFNPSTMTTYYARGYSGSGCYSTSCESVTITIVSAPTAVTVSGGGSFCSSATLSASGTMGDTIYWQGTTSSGTSVSSASTSQVVTASGTYYFRAHNTCGWGAQGSATVTINPSPNQPGAITGDIDVASGVTKTYSISPVTGATSYTWTVPVGLGWVINSGQGTTSINVTTGNYSGQVCVSAHNDCGDSPQTCLDIACAIPENIGIERLNIFPNPSDGEFLLEMNISRSQDITIKVFDAIGNMVYENNKNDISGKYHEFIDLSKNARGSYYLQITGEEGVINSKVVLQ
ncbi:MAG TPA: T9SS type A sorting domain-containing protein [Bacteroidales bacterium]|nr:T9SS type A sorting domain-containing protein [Bacteroidales bacterium]